MKEGCQVCVKNSFEIEVRLEIENNDLTAIDEKVRMSKRILISYKDVIVEESDENLEDDDDLEKLFPEILKLKYTSNR